MKVESVATKKQVVVLESQEYSSKNVGGQERSSNKHNMGSYVGKSREVMFESQDRSSKNVAGNDVSKPRA